MAIGTYYLKYRPQSLAELDSVDIRQQLEKVLRSPHRPHAFLFSGPKGTGKTSAARIVAKAINCEKRHTSEVKSADTSEVKYEPCNQCDICREITNGTALDLMEIDAASNRGIDDMRNLREKIKLSPARCQYKVYIIDEVHMLTLEAFNALLKTLEEPPEHAVFILCTTQAEKLPATIVSRCLQFNFKKARPEEIISGSLGRAVVGEKLELEKGVLEMIARAAGGSFRDGHKILEQLSFGGRRVTLAETQKLLGQLEETKPTRLLQFLAAGKITAGVEEIDRVVNLGADLSIYTLNILEELRTLLLAKIGLTGFEVDQDLLKALSKENLVRLIALFSRAAREMKDSPIAQLPLELTVVEWGENEIKNLKFKIKNCQEEESSKGQKDFDPPPAAPQFKTIENKWTELLAQVRPQNHSVEALLRASRPLNLEGETLTLEVFYQFHKEKLETEKCRAIVEETASQILGKPVRLKCVLGQKKPAMEKVAADSDIMTVASEIFNGKLVS